MNNLHHLRHIANQGILSTKTYCQLVHNLNGVISSMVACCQEGLWFPELKMLKNSCPSNIFAIKRFQYPSKWVFRGSEMKFLGLEGSYGDQGYESS